MEPQITPESSKARSSTGSEAEIRSVMDQFSSAVRAKDINKIMSFYADDIVAFDVMPPLQVTSVADYRKNWEMFSTGTQGPVTYEFSDQHVHTSGDLGLFFCISHMNFNTDKGQQMECWMRYTCGLKKIGAEWKIIHENNSIPVDMETDKAIWNLAPDKNLSH